MSRFAKPGGDVPPPDVPTSGGRRFRTPTPIDPVPAPVVPSEPSAEPDHISLPPAEAAAAAVAVLVASAAAHTGAPGGPGRAARRRDAQPPPGGHRGQLRRLLMGVGGGALPVIALSVLVFWGMHRSSASVQIPVAPSPSDSVVQQPTMFFQLRDFQSLAVGNVLMAVGGPANQGVELQTPSQLLLDAPTGGSLTLAEIAKLPDVNSSANALSDVLGVRIDSTLAMDHLAFAGLVDAVGGVTVAVPADLDVMVVGKDGSKKVLIPKGTRKLDGFTAVAYASYQEPGSLSGPQLARFALVLNAVLSQLPADQGQIESILNSLGSSANSTVPTAQAATFLFRMRAEIVANQLQNENLQTTPINTGGVTTLYQVDLAKANQQTTTLLSEALRVPGPNSKVRVLVQNGVGTPGLNAEARLLLVNAGFSFVNGGNNPGGFQPAAKTSIIVPDNSATSLQWGRDVATALQVSPSDIHTPGTAAGQSYADVIVTLGADFMPSATPSPS